MHCYGEQRRTIAQTNVWFVNPRKAKFKSSYSKVTSMIYIAMFTLHLLQMSRQIVVQEMFDALKFSVFYPYYKSQRVKQNISCY